MKKSGGADGVARPVWREEDPGNEWSESWTTGRDGTRRCRLLILSLGARGTLRPSHFQDREHVRAEDAGGSWKAVPMFALALK